jgi:uncharacterized membrane protein
VIFAYVWRAEPHDAWEDSHWQWPIRTFWIGLAYGVVATIGSIITLGLGAVIFFPLLAIWFAVRAIKALVAAQKHEPMHNVETWLF